MQKCNRKATVTYASRCCLLSKVQLRLSDCLPLTSVPKPRFAEPSPIAMENRPFIDGLPIKNGDFPWLC